MFRETFYHTMDEKGRLAIPSKLRKSAIIQQESLLIVAKGLDTNLFLFTEKDWNKYIESRVMDLPIGDGNVRHFLRFFVSGSAECQVDRSGRIMIPQTLADYAHINREVVINGAGFFMEIWARELWNDYFKENEEKLKDYAREFFSRPIQE